MIVRRFSQLRLVTALVAVGTGFVLNKAVAAERSWTDVEVGVQVLTRGPVHEAFAETVSYDPEPGVMVQNAPPIPIEEVPPDARPEGNNIAWIPGYSAWDDEQDDYLWISGVWRAPPPGRQWVSGYWGRSEHGSQWTCGYWANAQLSEVQYLPEPPETLEVGPSIVEPSPNQSWIPGCWIWNHTRYAWRPGYWMAVQPSWTWIPAHYVCTPRGYVFVSGYWDYSVARRGILFAPVHFDAGVYGRRGFSYSPIVVIDSAVFSDQLFVRPRYQHYYFGDYYDPGYRQAGFYASFSYQSSRRGYDPIYAHQRWEHRQDHDWDRHVEGDFRDRREHVEARPPRTLALQLQLSATKVDSGERRRVFATSLDRLAKRTDTPMRLQALDKDERKDIIQRGQEVRKFSVERQKLETRATNTSADKPSREAAPVKVRLPRSPIVARSVDQLAKDQAPPTRPPVPKRDLKIEPKPRTTANRAATSVQESRTRGAPNNQSSGESKNKDKDKDKDKDKPKNQ